MKGIPKERLRSASSSHRAYGAGGPKTLRHFLRATQRQLHSSSIWRLIQWPNTLLRRPHLPTQHLLPWLSTSLRGPLKPGAAPAPAVEYVAPLPDATYAAPAPAVEYVDPPPDVTYAAPAPVNEHMAPVDVYRSWNGWVWRSENSRTLFLSSHHLSWSSARSLSDGQMCRLGPVGTFAQETESFSL